MNVTASTSDYNIAEAIIFQDTLTIIAVSNGSATITLTAQDTDGNRAADTFEVTVAAAQQQKPGADYLLGHLGCHHRSRDRHQDRLPGWRVR